MTEEYEQEIERVREDARTFLALVDESPRGPVGGDEGAFDHSDLGRLFVRLPQEDRGMALDELRSVAVSAATITSRTDFVNFLRRSRKILEPWRLTAQQWVGNPSVERLVGVLTGNGPVLSPSTPSSTDQGHQRLMVRAVDDDTAQQWRLVVAKLPEAADWLSEKAATGKFESSRCDEPLRGRLGWVHVDDTTFAQREVRFSGYVRRGRRTQKDRGPRHTQVEMRMLYAVDEDKALLWVTSVNLFKIELGHRPPFVYWALQEDRHQRHAEARRNEV